MSGFFFEFLNFILFIFLYYEWILYNNLYRQVCCCIFLKRELVLQCYSLSTKSSKHVRILYLDIYMHKSQINNTFTLAMDTWARKTTRSWPILPFVFPHCNGKNQYIYNLSYFPMSPEVWLFFFSLWQCLRILNVGASLVAQWLRICLLMQGTRVRALVWEDPTCHGVTRPVSHNYWACASGACAPQQERPRQWEARAPRWRVAPACHN